MMVIVASEAYITKNILHYYEHVGMIDYVNCNISGMKNCKDGRLEENAGSMDYKIRKYG